MNISGTPAHKYDRASFRSNFGSWADFIHPTAMAKERLYHTLNTYGIAHFKEKLAQYARQYSLDGADEVICLVVADIRHNRTATTRPTGFQIAPRDIPRVLAVPPHSVPF